MANQAPTSQTLAEISERAVKRNKYYAVVRYGRRTRRIVGVYCNRLDAEMRANAYKGKIYEDRRYVLYPNGDILEI